MTTSLAEQLEKLRTPQTGLLLQDKKRPSLLFDPKEAANLDRETVLNIGQSGLQDLIKLCEAFREFEETLFATSSLRLERSVQNKSINKRLDDGIEKFLILLSPYFLLNAAHKALEWLIHRFHIHQFNKKHFLLLILPYHETRMFVRALQLVNLTGSREKWVWLKPLQELRVALPPLTLVSRVAGQDGFLKMLCYHVVRATAIHADRANCLSTLYAFYTMTVVGTIDRSPALTEVQLDHMLSSLLKGLDSTIPDFAASSYMILAKLTTKAQLTDETMIRLLHQTLKAPDLKKEAMHLVFFIYAIADDRTTPVSIELVRRISELPWFIDETIDIKALGVKVGKFIVPLLETAFEIILTQPDESQRERTMINEIFARITFDDADIDKILKNALKPCNITNKTTDESKQFLAELYGILERGYPLRFDEYLKTVLKPNNSESREIMNFLISWHAGARYAKESFDILYRLNHFRPQQRIAVLEEFRRGDIDTTKGLPDDLKMALIARFNDDNVPVVQTLLEFPIERLTSLFSNDTLVDELLFLLAKCHGGERAKLAVPAMKLLLEVSKDGDDTSVFIATLPYLFPDTPDEVAIAMQILRSDFAKQNRYMTMVKQDLENSPPDAEAIGAAAFHNILKPELLPPIANILTTMRLHTCNEDASSLFFNFLILGSVCRVPVGSLPNHVAREIIEITADVLKQYPKVRQLPDCNHLTGDKIREALTFTSKQILPLQAATYVIEMIHRRLDIKTNSILDFENDHERAQLVMRIPEILLNGMNSERHRSHYSWCLKIFFQRHFASFEDMMKFLSQFFIEPVNPQTSLHCLKMVCDLLHRSNFVQWIFQDKLFTTNLLVALARDNVECRDAAIDILKKLSQTFNLTMKGFSVLFMQLSTKTAELSMHHEQLSLILYNLLSPDPDVRHQIPKNVNAELRQAQQLIFDTIIDQSIPIHTISQLLDVLVHVNGPSILQLLATFGLELHKKLHEKSDERTTKLYSSNALKNILQRFNATTVEALAHDTVWRLFETAINDHKLRINVKSTTLTPSAIIIKQIDEVFYEKVGKSLPQLQRKIVAKLVDVVTDCEIGSIVAASNRAVRRIKIDAQLVVNEIKAMKQTRNDEGTMEPRRSIARSSRRSSSKIQTLRPEVINSRQWKRGITLLEFVQCATNIENEELLVPVLFDLLRTCLGFEEQSPLEYTNQLLLSTIHQLATKGLPIPDPHLQVDVISQCIRISHNPQTHHHALLVLVELFKIADVNTALHNIMPIFTFMGSSVLRQDDAYSIQIISKTIETIVPIVNAVNDEKHACQVLRIFIVSLPDIPEHRRIPLFVKLLQLLENHLHLFYLITFESHVISQINDATSRQLSMQRIEFALNISQQFAPQLLVDVSVKLLEFVKILPVEIDDDNRDELRSFRGKHVFDVANNSPKQLRHYRYTVVQFLNALLSAPEFVNRVAVLGAKDSENIKTSHDRLIVELVLLIESACKSADVNQGKPKGKYWKVLLHNLYDILDAVNALLPNEAFVASIKRLVAHDLLTVRKKALELLNSRLQQKRFTKDDHEHLLEFIESLVEIVSRQGKILSNELEIIQQTALITMKLLARLLAKDHPAFFKPILDLSTELLKTTEGPMLASAVLCVAELCSSMRVHAVKSLSKFGPAVIRLLRTHCHQESPDIVVVSIVSALQKIVESLGNFLSMYLDQLLLELTSLSARYTDTEHPKIGLVVSRLDATSQKLAGLAPMRVLLPAIGKTYQNLLATKSYQCVPPLMNILAESFSHVTPKDMQAAIPDLATFFLKVLQFRENITIVGESDMDVDKATTATIKDVVSVEESAGKAVVALVLKLSEATFTPFYRKLYDWAARNPKYRQRNITFYRLSANIAERLKSLFVLFAGHFLKHAASLLKANNPSVSHEHPDLTLPEESNKIELTETILLTLYRVFSYDAHNFVNQERFDTLAQPIVDQIDNTMGTIDDYVKRSNDLIIPCIAAFASATQDDSLHKQLVYQTLLKTRHTKPYVRNTALGALVEIARKLGEDFMPLLAETIPFLAELLEDDDEGVETSAQNAVRTLEDILGEPLQKYF